MWKNVATALKDLPYVAAYEILSEPRVRCSFANCRTVSPEVVRSFYEEAAHAITSVDARTPMVIGPAPFYHVDGLPAMMPVPADLHDRLIYAFNWFVPRTYVNGGLQISYPGTIGCCDAHEREPSSSCPRGCNEQAPMERRASASSCCRCLTLHPLILCLRTRHAPVGAHGRGSPR